MKYRAHIAPSPDSETIYIFAVLDGIKSAPKPTRTEDTILCGILLPCMPNPALKRLSELEFS